MSRLSAELVALSVKPPDPFGELVPQPFDPSRTEYTWDLPESVHSVVITASLPPGATLTIDDVNWPAAGMSWDLPISTNQVVLRVRSESGRTKDYTLTVNRVDNSAKEITGFRINGQSYQIDEAAGSTITAVLPAGSSLDDKRVQIYHTGESITLTGGSSGMDTDWRIPLQQPANFSVVDFSGGAREFIITAIDGTTQTYTVTVSAAGAQFAAMMDGTSYISLAAAIEDVLPGSLKTITLLRNVEIPEAGRAIDDYVIKQNWNVRIYSDAACSITAKADMGGNGLFTVNVGAALELGGGTGMLTLDGGGASQVAANRRGVFTMGRFELLENAAITGFFNTAFGGGVYVSNGEFIMLGGKIAANSANYGGGVCVAGGTFTMNGGTIYGFNENINSNQALAGASLYVAGGTAQYGTTLAGGGTALDIIDSAGGTDRTDDTLPSYAARIGTAHYLTLTKAIAAVPAGTEASPTEIVLLKNVNSSSLSIDQDRHIRLAVEDGKEFSINLASGEEYYLASIFAGTSLTLGRDTGTGKLTLDGGGSPASGRQAVAINGKLVMNNNVTIKDFKNTTGTGGAITINNGAQFLMKGGTIENNAAPEGAGVYINSGTFTMAGGVIAGNAATISGGGVSVSSSGIFYMEEGTIYGNTDADTSKRNTAPIGSSLSNRGTAKYGTPDSPGADIITGGIGDTNDTLTDSL